MSTPQAGIFALGTASHEYLELDLRQGVDPGRLVTALANLREPHTTMGGVNLVSGFRPELWRQVLPGGIPDAVTGFDRDIEGADGYVMPATQHDAILWLSASAYDVIFDNARAAIRALAPIATVASETSSWPYRHDRDLTGFIDGTKNPSLLRAPDIALIPQGEPGAGGSVLLFQKWVHESAAWESLPEGEQEKVIGRTKPDSVELDPQVADSHVAKTDQEDFGDVFRRNMPYGDVSEHGTMFVGFAAEQRRLMGMLDSMAGRLDGVRDALTNYSRPLSGAVYFIPSAEDLRGFATELDQG